jgi:hypothetical protein
VNSVGGFEPDILIEKSSESAFEHGQFVELNIEVEQCGVNRNRFKVDAVYCFNDAFYNFGRYFVFEHWGYRLVFLKCRFIVAASLPATS